jgi:hypothetical protein
MFSRIDFLQNPCNVDTLIIRTVLLCPKSVRIEGFHCSGVVHVCVSQCVVYSHVFLVHPVRTFVFSPTCVCAINKISCTLCTYSFCQYRPIVHCIVLCSAVHFQRTTIKTYTKHTPRTSTRGCWCT